MGNNNVVNNKKGRRAIYLTIEKFEKFRTNEFFHLRVEVRVAIIISCTILAILLTR